MFDLANIKIQYHWLELFKYTVEQRIKFLKELLKDANREFDWVSVVELWNKITVQNIIMDQLNDFMEEEADIEQEKLLKNNYEINE